MSGKLESIKINGSLCSSAFNDECPFLNRKGTEYGYEHTAIIGMGVGMGVMAFSLLMLQ